MLWGLSYLDIGKLSVAVMYFEQAVWISRAENSLALEGKALGNLGLAYKALGYLVRSIEFQEEHLAISRELQDLSEEGRALDNLGQAYRQLGNYNRAIAPIIIVNYLLLRGLMIALEKRLHCTIWGKRIAD